MTKPDHDSARISVKDLPANRSLTFDLEMSNAMQDRFVAALGLLGLRKFRFTGQIESESKADWHLSGHLGATVVQSCVVTLEPVTTRIDETVERRFLRDWHQIQTQADEAEMPEDETTEPLGDEIDLVAIAQEALSLALPAFPRSKDAELERVHAAPPGVDALEDEQLKPFAELADLKKKLQDRGS